MGHVTYLLALILEMFFLIILGALLTLRDDVIKYIQFVLSEDEFQEFTDKHNSQYLG